MMRKGENYNHPRKGSIIIVDPIKSLDLVKAVQRHLRPNLQQWAIFIVGTNTNLRAIDITAIRSDKVFALKPLDIIKIREKKTGKFREVVLNKPCIDTIRQVLRERGNIDGHLFQNSIGGPTYTSYINKFIKRACLECGLEGNYGSHTMRKTWGYHQFRTYGVRIEDLMFCFNHSKPSQTMAYLGLSIEEVTNIYANEI